MFMALYPYTYLEKLWSCLMDGVIIPVWWIFMDFAIMHECKRVQSSDFGAHTQT